MTLGMAKQYYFVQNEFDPKKDYGIKIRPQYAKCLELLRKDEKINQKDFAESHGHQFTTDKNPKSKEEAVRHSFVIGRKIGILRPLSKEESGIPISYSDFKKLETVSYFIKQHKTSRYKNIKPERISGTGDTYANRLWAFNNWLHGKEFEFTRIEPSGKDTFRRKIQKIKLKGIEHLLKLYQEHFSQEREFIKIVKTFLMDPEYENLSAKYVKIMYNAIKSYFEKNDSILNFKFDPSARHKVRTDEDEQASLSIDELIQLLTIGNPTLVQKSAFMCKFHRGLDTSTLIDRFNFEAWSQLVKYFGGADYSKWDLTLCPAPIFLTRIKTGVAHTGFLERDAVDSIRKYLDFRKKKTGTDMKEGEAIFLTEKRKPINKEWIASTMSKLRKNAGLDKTLSGYKITRYKINSHEFRDLLKSTLIDCGVRPDIADHAIGHAPKDSYEKQATLYPRTLRDEYAKASKRLNIFSNITSMAKGSDRADEIEERMKKMEGDLHKIKKRVGRTNPLRKKRKT